MTSAPFTTRTGDYTDSELRADLALCRKVLREGYVNGYPLDSETEVEWRDWLSDFEGEIEMREEERAPIEAPPFTDAQIDAAQERMERLLGFTDAPLSNAA